MVYKVHDRLYAVAKSMLAQGYQQLLLHHIPAAGHQTSAIHTYNTSCIPLLWRCQASMQGSRPGVMSETSIPSWWYLMYAWWSTQARWDCDWEACRCSWWSSCDWKHALIGFKFNKYIHIWPLVAQPANLAAARCNQATSYDHIMHKHVLPV